ncbi:MAG TPA: primosomal protein N' [Bacteroidia bacterium]|jgi:primosomal protein N' (replication factor Y)|nr:primosomal protein N' [Bacteroidia bacterium]
MPERIDLFADIILPLPIANVYTYRVPQELNDVLTAGVRVVVQFGKKKLYSGIVEKIHSSAPAYTAKYIESLIDERPVVQEKQLAFWKWMSEYYLCTKGDVMLAALPAGLRLSSETKIVLNETWDGDRATLNNDQFSVIEALDVRKTLTIEEMVELLQKKTVYPMIKELLEIGVILVYEELQQRYHPKYETYVRLADAYEDEEKLKEAFAQLEKKYFKQLETLMAFVHLSDRYGKKNPQIRKSDLLKTAGASLSSLKSLVKKEILIEEELEVSRLLHKQGEGKDLVLSVHQQEAFDKIKEEFKTKEVCLLKGITSSGKTEVYIKFIREQMELGKQVLYLLPEIALTTQLIVRLQKHFGEKVFVYHSRYNENERVEVWNEVLKNEPLVVIGARSAVFLPFAQLGIAIIDEEHDSSFKQNERAPRYNARDCAIWLAREHNAHVILGSATPSIETFYKTKDKKFGYAELTERYGGSSLPHIEIVDIKDATRKKLMSSHFSPTLVEKMTGALEKKEQVILFHNRRGFAPSIECQDCGHIPHCVRCDVSLTFHKHSNQLRCHYCGWTMNPPSHCEACGNVDLRMKGFGTEKIEEELQLIFPDAKIARMDLDTTRGKFALQKLVNDFEEKKIDILVGTQMVTKGLDFENVSLVGVLQADQLMNYPDFRAVERSYQLMSQVAGRAGRREQQGEVIIQTFNPQHPVIDCVMHSDYFRMYENEIVERREFHYPPFHRLIRLTLKSKDHILLDEAALHFANTLRSHFADRILGPEFPPVSKVRDEFLKNILVKIESEANIFSAKLMIAREIAALRVHPDFKKVTVVTDVDPM